MTAISPFDFKGSSVRVHIDERGEPWFIAKDVCDCLGLENVSRAISRLRDTQKGVTTSDTLGGPQEFTTVNESGLFDLVLTSRKPEAQAFRAWVTDEVLPSIRKTGSYGTPKVETFEARVLGVMQELVAKVDSQARQLAEAAPKVAFVDSFMESDGLYGLQNAARALGCKPDWFIAKLTQTYLFRQGGHLVPFSEHINRGIFVVKNSAVGNRAFPQTFLTPKGLYHVATSLNLGQLVLPGVN
jgi:prophage antirepressor-like protein